MPHPAQVPRTGDAAVRPAAAGALVRAGAAWPHALEAARAGAAQTTAQWVREHLERALALTRRVADVGREPLVEAGSVRFAGRPVRPLGSGSARWLAGCHPHAHDD